MTKLLLEKELINEIAILLKNNPNCVIGIDGRCGAGKSTFSNFLSGKFGFQIVHMDDFFLPLKLRTPERFNEIAGNIHKERFIKQVVENLERGKSFSYTKFDCQKLQFTKNIEITAKKPLIIEGAYCMLEEFEHLYDMKIFVNIDNETQKIRIIERNGEEAYHNFEKMWIPKEERYIKEKNIRQKCDFEVITTFKTN
ncbi:MAG: uridine kinase [Clostridia bacterium]